MLSFAGIKPIRESLFRLAFADDKKHTYWLDRMCKHGGRSD
jgi:hypothetical protein